VVTFAAMKKTLVIDQEPAVVNPNQLFHRIACVVRSAKDLEDCLRHELAPYPQALFDDVGLRAGVKSKIGQVIDEFCKGNSEMPENPTFVLDVGDLLHRVPRPRPVTFGDLCKAYKEYVRRHFGERVVVFDGYEASTKDAVHGRRCLGKSSARLEVTTSNILTAEKQQFLSNVDNKTDFVKLPGYEFQAENVLDVHAPSDADVLIVETDKKEAESGQRTVIVGADSDLLVLTAALTQPDHSGFLLVPGS